MADVKISELTSMTGAGVSDTNDVLVIVDTSAGVTRKISRAQLLSALSTLSMNTNNPSFRMDDSDTANNAELTLDNANFRIEVDEDNAVAGSALVFRVDGTEKAQINENGFVIKAGAVPASATDTGMTGQIAWDNNFLYLAVGTNTWKRAALSTW